MLNYLRLFMQYLYILEYWTEICDIGGCIGNVVHKQTGQLAVIKTYYILDMTPKSAK